MVMLDLCQQKNQVKQVSGSCLIMQSSNDRIQASVESSLIVLLSTRESLNDVVLQGPNHLNNLAGVLIRFRKEPVAVVGDIKLMFHQCFVKDKNQRFLRFL